MSKNPFKITYKNGQKTKLKKLNLKDLKILEEKRDNLKNFVSTNSIFKNNMEDTYEVYLKDTEFHQLVNDIYIFLDINYKLLNKEDIIDFILPWEDPLVNDKDEDVPNLHLMGKIFEYLLPNHKENKIISMNVINKLAHEFSDVFKTIKNIDKIVGETLQFSAKELNVFFNSESIDYENLDDFLKDLKRFEKIEKRIKEEIESNPLLKSYQELGNR